ncbi:type III endosome membrane protein TEMP [Stigmatopora nigra]
MDALVNTSTLPITTSALNDTTKTTSHRWEFLLAVLVTAISISILIALLAKWQVVWRYLSSYRHTRLREMDTVSQYEQSGLEVGFDIHGESDINLRHAVHAEDDDGFIEDNYIPTSERVRAERAEKNMEDNEDTEDEMDENEFTIT